MFNVLLEKTEGTIQKQDSVMRNALSAKLKLEVTCRYLATGDSLASLQYLYRVPKCSISRFLPEVLEAIYIALKEFIQVPNKEHDWNRIVEGFSSRWNFPECIGAMDGKHVVVQCPANSGSQYYNYKGTFSIVLLALVDDNYNFSCIDIGSYRSYSDGGIFAKSALQKAIEVNSLNIPTGSFILGDEAFPLKTYLMKPYPRRNNLTVQEKIYNYRHSRARRIVENAFGILASRFRVFRKPILLSPNTVTKVVKASCALHNWIRKQGRAENRSSISVDIEDFETGRIIPGSWRSEPKSVGLLDLTASTHRNYLPDARQKRDNYAKYFMEEGSVSWQQKMIQ